MTNFTPTNEINKIETVVDLLNLLRDCKGFKSLYFNGEQYNITSISDKKITYKYPVNTTGWHKPLDFIKDLKSGKLELIK